MIERVYLDNNATTPMDNEVLEAMMPYLTSIYGNASSRSHIYGWEALDAVEKARAQVAEFVGVNTNEIIFTSGATEADNLALKGYVGGDQAMAHIIAPVTEHKAIIDTCMFLQSQGVKITWLPVNTEGLIDLNKLALIPAAENTLLAVMWVNNETGVIQPIEKISKISQEKGWILMSDATQAPGKIPVMPKEAGVQLMAFSAHKMYGPKGVGALFVDSKAEVKLQEQLHGGGHERNLRSGTLNVPGIVGFGKAAELARQRLQNDEKRMSELRDYLENTLITSLAGVLINGNTKYRVANTTNLQFTGVHSEDLLLALGAKVALSSGSACTSAEVEPSHVLTSMGLTDDLSFSSIRFSLGRYNTREEIDFSLEQIIDAVNRLRAHSNWQQN